MRKLAEGGLFLGKLGLVLLVLGLVALPAMAQNVPKLEVFGGYQYNREGFSNGVNLNGWNAAVTANLSRHFGVTGDFSGVYATVPIPLDDGGTFRVSEYTYMFGPVISGGRDKTLVPFAHALFGGFRESGINGFAMAFGGGIDVKASRHLAIRVVQADWLLERAGGDTSNKNIRISAGIVFRF